MKRRRWLDLSGSGLAQCLVSRPWTPLRRAALLSLAGLALLAAPGAASPLEEPSVAWRHKTGLLAAPDPLAADIDLDRRFEIIQTGLTNTVSALDAASGRLLWKRDLGNHKLMTPVAGNFLGQGRINIAVASVEGTIFLLDGATGRTLKTYDCGYVLAMPPTAFPWTREDPAQPFREGLILYDQNLRLQGVMLNPTLGMEQVFQFDTRGQLNAPPVVGRTSLPAPEPHVAFVTFDGVLSVFSGRQPSVSASGAFENAGRCQKGVTLGDLNGDGRQDLVAADTAGMIHAFTVQGNRLAPLWAPLQLSSMQRSAGPVTYRTVLREPTFTPVTLDVNGDHRDDILVPSTDGLNDGYLLLDGTDGLSLWGPHSAVPTAYAHARKIESPPAVFGAGGGAAYVVFSDVLGVNLLPLWPQGTPARLDLGRSASVTPLVAPFCAAGQAGEAQAYLRTSTDGLGHLIRLGLPLSNQPAACWLGWRGGAWRGQTADAAAEAFRQAQLDALAGAIEQTLRQAQALGAQHQWDQALRLVRSIKAWNPDHQQANALYRQFFLRRYLPWLVLAGAGGLAVLVAAALVGWRYGRALIERRLARQAIARQQWDRAIHLLYNLCARFPQNRSYLPALADLYIQQQQFDQESAAIFERARHFYPTEERFLKALATAYSAIPRHDETAAAIYQEMTRVAKKPGPWHFLLGQAQLALGRPREALAAFRQTVIHGHDDPRLPGLMSDLYIQLGMATPEILPTLDRVLPERMEDPAFLRLYVQACQEARRYDELAGQVALRLLEFGQEEPAAHLILATRLLQSGQHQEAMLHAQQVLQQAPNDPAGLRLLGASYAAERRIDAAAMQIFLKALQANPDAPELLVAVSHGYAQEDRQDAEAREIYTRALVHQPQDEIILAQMARIADRDGDSELALRALEPLLALGRRQREWIQQLAQAYARLGLSSDKAEPIYREALAQTPDQPALQDNLAVIYLRKGRDDGEAAPIYAAALGRHPDRFDLGMQLMRCHVAAERPDKALELGRRLLEMEPDNADLRKMLAAASERANQMDSAISGYEQILAEQPADREALCALASLYGRKRLSDNHSIEIYNQAMQLEPERAEHALAAARAYADRESWDHALQVLKHLLARVPGALPKALELLERLAEAAPGNLPLRWYLVDTLIFAGHLREARQHVVQILRQAPDQAEPALGALDRILEKTPKDALAHFERGRVLLALRREGDARLAMEQAHRYQLDNAEIVRELMDLYQRLLEKRDSAEVRFQRGRLAMQVEKYDLAISCFQITSRDYRWEGESLRNLARCFIAKGMLDLALQELRRLPLDEDIKELLYDLGQRYEAAHDIHGAREVYKIIFAADITFRDVKSKLETLSEAAAAPVAAERTALIGTLSEEAKRRYELVQELGRGAMGIVYKARDNELDEYVALKILPDSMIRNADAIKRFRQEARNARRLAHPHIVRIHDIGEEAGRKYISMEFVQGSDLKQKLRQARRQLPFATTLNYARQICEAMAYAHEQGIVHRDIKPANLMITQDDQIKVTDFGIAKMVEPTNPGESTSGGAIVGTPLYMSPEQVKGLTVDHRADIYSMGVVFYEMACGQPPFIEGDLSYQHLFAEPKPLSGAPEPFARIVMRCLAKEKERRWQSARQILDELNKITVD